MNEVQPIPQAIEDVINNQYYLQLIEDIETVEQQLDENPTIKLAAIFTHMQDLYEAQIERRVDQLKDILQTAEDFYDCFRYDLITKDLYKTAINELYQIELRTGVCVQ